MPPRSSSTIPYASPHPPIPPAWSSATDLILLHGNADGSFNTPPIYDKTFGDHNTEYDGEGTFQVPIYVGDVNGDGVQDLLGNSGDGLAVLLGGPHLTSRTPLHYPQAVLRPSPTPPPFKPPSRHS